jgi:hypothetical protein
MNPKELINKKGSFAWIKCNEDAKSHYFREQFLKKFGGNFCQEENGNWLWEELETIVEKNDINIHNPVDDEPERLYKITTPDNEVFLVENLAEFVEEHKEFDLKVKGLYTCSSKNSKGLKSKYKGFSCIKLKG